MTNIMRAAMKALDDEDAGTFRASHTFEVRIPSQDIEDLCDMAGYGIGYWARKATVDAGAKSYHVYMDAPDDVSGVPGDRVLPFEWMARMIVRLAAADPSLKGIALNGQTALACRRYVGSILAGQPDFDLDSADADVIVQLCYFRGEVVYG